jgi:transposase-like protein
MTGVDDSSDAKIFCGDTPLYQQEEVLRAAYEDTESIRAAAQRFDASYHTVRNWLIEYGIHEPQSREGYSTAAVLEGIEADAVGREEA